MKTKWKLPILALLAGITNDALGFLWVVVTCTTIVIGAAGIYVLTVCAKLVDQPTTQAPLPYPEHVLRIWYQANGQGMMVYDNVPVIIIPPVYRPGVNDVIPDPPGSQKLYYGLDDVPWQQMSIDPSINKLNPITYTSSNYWWTVAVNGVRVKITSVQPTYSDTNDYTSEVMDEDQGYHTMVIYRAHNLWQKFGTIATWFPIYTNNYVTRYNAFKYLDTTAPADHAYYMTELVQ